MYTVIKRDGRSAEFNLARISHAITKAFDATGIPYTLPPKKENPPVPYRAGGRRMALVMLMQIRSGGSYSAAESYRRS